MRVAALLALLPACSDAPVSPSAIRVSPTGPPPTSVRAGDHVLIRLKALSGDAPFAWSRSGTIPGLALIDDSGPEARYQGTAEVPGSFFVSIMVRDASGNHGVISINLTVIQSEPPPKVSFAEPSTRLVLGQPFQLFPDSSGGEPPVTWASSGLPRGVYFDPDSRSIVGTPEIVGSFTIALRMEDALMRSAEASCTLEVRETLAIERRTLPHAIAGMPYREDLEVRGGEPPYSWSVDGLLPTGLSIAEGALQGTPQSPGEHAFTIGVTDAWSTFVGQTYLMTVADSAGDPSVALWPIPPFGRTADDFFVYTSSIVDPITQVAWTSIAADATSLSDAAAHCAALGGDWRLPTWIELASIGGPYAAMIEAPIDAPYFAIWSADGRTWEGAGPGESGALCARADPVPAIPRYAPILGGSFDRFTGLVWAAENLTCARDGRWGTRFCAELGAGERSDWREANVRELLSAIGPGTIGAGGYFADPEERGVYLDVNGSVRTGSTAEQWCMRDARFDCAEINPEVTYTPSYPIAGQEVLLESASTGGGSCPLQYSWQITAPDGSTGWPAYALLQQDRQSESLRFVPLQAGLYQVSMTIDVDGFRSALRTVILVEPNSCELTLTISDDGRALTAMAEGGIPPYRYAWHATSEDCAGLGGYTTGFGEEDTVEYSTAPGVGVTHRVVAVDAGGCLGTASVWR